MSIEKEQAAKVQKRAVRAALTVFRFTRNVFALGGLFFAYLLWHGYSAYEADIAASAQDTACVKPSQCM